MQNETIVGKFNSKIVPINDYKNTFIANCKKNVPAISTGILGVDKILNGGLQNKLMILAAESSAGKSAYMYSLAYNVASHGHDAILFSLEMPKDELIARGVSRLSYEQKLNKETSFSVSSTQILSFTYSPFEGFTKLAYETYSDAVEKYFTQCGEHLYIVEGGMEGLTVKEVVDLTETFKNKTGKTPVVFVDYLQLLKADPSDRAQVDRKTKLDVAVTTLKALTYQVGVPVFALSSVSRSGYGHKINMASFKESGDIEFTADFLFGLNWIGVTNAKDDATAAMEIKESDKRGYRKMQLELLKYRNGVRFKSINLDYYPAYSYFVESGSQVGAY